MSIDLERSLDELARSVGDDHLAERLNGQVYRMVAQVRRRRAARYTANGVVGMGAAAAVVIGGLQLAGRDEGAAPVATDAPDTTPTPTPLPGCGEVAPTAAPDVGDMHVTGQASSPTQYGGPMSLELTVRNDGATMATARASNPLKVLVTQDGVVVATGTAVVDGAQVQPNGYPTSMSGPVDLVACGGDTPLGAGDYTAVTSVIVDLGDGTSVELVTVPLPFTIDANPLDTEAAGFAAIADITSGAAERGDAFAVCGSVVPLPADGPVAIDLALQDRAYTAGDAFMAQVRVRSTGTFRAGAQLSANNPQVVLTYQGVVVGRASTDSDAVPIDLGADGTATISAPASFTLCSLPGADAPEATLPPGTYLAYAVLTLTVDETTVDGTQQGPWEPVVIRSEPVDVTLG